MTDERITRESLLHALHSLPRGAGVVFRHYSLAPTARRALFLEVRTIAKRRRLVLLLAGRAPKAQAWGADGWHGRTRGPASMLHSAPAHNIREVRLAEASGADVLFVSPVFATRSHPGHAALGRVRFVALARKARRPVIALGGMTPARWRGIAATSAYGWAAIDAWQIAVEAKMHKVG